jgi:hypothetical protein
MHEAISPLTTIRHLYNPFSVIALVLHLTRPCNAVKQASLGSICQFSWILGPASLV